jgi:hypothetical protein
MGRMTQVMSVSPRYDQYKTAWDTSVTTNVLGEDIRFFHEVRKGVDRVFVDSPLFLAKVWGKTGSKLYGLKSGADFADNQKRFAVFCKVRCPHGTTSQLLLSRTTWTRHSLARSGMLPTFPFPTLYLTCRRLTESLSCLVVLTVMLATIPKQNSQTNFALCHYLS